MEPLVGGSAEAAIERTQQRNAGKQEWNVAHGTLLFVSFQHRPRGFEQGKCAGVLTHQKIPEMACKSRHKGLAREALFQHIVKQQQRTLVVAGEDVLGDTKICVVVEYVERCGHLFEREVTTAERHGLVEHRECIPHTTIGLASNQVERLVVVCHTLLTCDVFEVTHRILNAYAVEVVDLTT